MVRSSVDTRDIFARGYFSSRNGIFEVARVHREKPSKRSIEARQLESQLFRLYSHSSKHRGAVYF